ncbi:MAG: PorV/PorQ family protein [Elusimicrobia bacterium]|nr:PorV/PorQ family protein [Elusimicrobiota bacterium]
MKKNRVVAVLAVMLLMGNAGSASANHAAMFLRQEPTARMMSMGSTFAGVGEDSGAAYFNPAALGFMSQHRLASSTWEGVDSQSRYYFASGIVNGGWSGVFHANYLDFNSGKETISGFDGSERNVTLQDDQAIGAGWGHSLGDYLSLGGQVKWVQSKLAESFSANTATFDLGVMAKSKEGMLSMGLGVRNATGGLKYAVEENSLPRAIYGGGAARFKMGQFGRFLAGMDLEESEKKDSPDVHAGMEYGIGMFALRGGIKRVSEETSFTTGGGVAFKGLSFDYGFEPAGNLGQPIHKMTLNMTFGGPAGREDRHAAASHGLSGEVPVALLPKAAPVEVVTLSLGPAEPAAAAPAQAETPKPLEQAQDVAAGETATSEVGPVSQ